MDICCDTVRVLSTEHPQRQMLSVLTWRSGMTRTQRRTSSRMRLLTCGEWFRWHLHHVWFSPESGCRQGACHMQLQYYGLAAC